MGNSPSASFEDKALQTAAEKGNLPYVKSLVEKDGANVNFVDQYGWSALLQAVSEAHASVVNYLLSKGANVFQKNADGSTAMHLAVAADSEEIVNTLIAQGLDVNAQNENGWTPLHLACLQGNPSVVSILLQNGADCNKINRDGNTPLKVTTSLAVSKVIREFQESKASNTSNASSSSVNDSNNNNNNEGCEMTVYDNPTDSSGGQSTREQIQQLRSLQNRARPQPVEMKGYTVLSEAEDSLLDNRSNNIRTSSTNKSTVEKLILAAINTLRDLNPEVLNLVQIDELLEFHKQQTQKYTNAKQTLEEKRKREMDKLMAD